MLVSNIDLGRVDMVKLFENGYLKAVAHCLKCGYKPHIQDIVTLITLNKPLELQALLHHFPDLFIEIEGTVATDFACDYNLLEVLDVLLSFKLPVSLKRLDYISGSDLPQNQRMKEMLLKHGLISC